MGIPIRIYMISNLLVEFNREDGSALAFLTSFLYNTNVKHDYYGALAQWIESQTSNLSVGGSSPSCLANHNHPSKGWFAQGL